MVINKIIIHDVPKHKKDEMDIQPYFIENESEISDKLKLLFKDKISSALQKDIAFLICYDNKAKIYCSVIHFKNNAKRQ